MRHDTKLIGLSADPADRHEPWARDIDEAQAAKVRSVS
jgi:alkyl hydroperoxide reductase subunit AhpC